ncbi:unnamed protein product [Cyclocybe aegerita]|uniref:Uncharacterized protein n=1 Tax=Cyclocybe aegerita TaxID=1973307 RepID=A0A8S0XQV2_CYCAE|nr:unnamed protein product [Cyclocybe aegerita]
MFTKTQFIAATVVLASTLSANAAPALGQEHSLERRTHGNGGWITPAPGKGRAGKIRQAHEIAAVENHKASEPHHHAVAHGNKAHVHDTFHSTHGGPDHATVKYSNAHGHHVSTLHIAKDGTRLQGDAHPPSHHSGTHAPPNSPRELNEYIELLQRALDFYDDLD